MERLLRELRPIGVDAEREGSYSREKRADIKVIFRQINVPIEIKRHYHKDLWSALKEQLIEKYTNDPGAQGWGIYLVLWYGLEIKKLPNPPKGIDLPASAEDLREALLRIIPEEASNLIEVICIDCSP